ncbi:RNA polymerase subunit sigma [Bradyrhizobium genosp. SA-3]|uniref:sigma-70 family RNA polymerase sigma factor n=1 Tax=Bradyrhizobium genosp. SA-3 TaxID=508868 RepID=UPI00102A16E0|nr:sigma-70 family RNA polymerase sigma factor [Bradyrhizobium genosp. SA-3]RZN11143.1 RNA polymerase subunit sigma [Bradyrhizobium genosp. SA-3]
MLPSQSDGAFGGSLDILVNEGSRSRPSDEADRSGQGHIFKETTKTNAPSHRARASCDYSQSQASDDDLIKRIAVRDTAAMHILYVRHRAKVFKFIRGLVRGRENAEDLASQVFLDVWHSAGSFEGRSRVSTWLLSIARFKALGYLRKRMHDRIDDVELPEIIDEAESPEATIDRTKTKVVLRSCIGKLCPAHRIIIDLVYYHERSVAEVSEILDIPRGTVKTRMFYARRQLASLLDSAGVDSVAANFDRDRPSPPMLTAKSALSSPSVNFICAAG